MKLPRATGAALILVVVVIAALVAIATPFAVSMRLHEKSARGFSSRVKARRLCEAVRNDAVAALYASHPDEERRARLARQDAQGDDEDWDSLDELAPRPRDLRGVETLAARGTTTTMQEVQVRDERGKIDLNGAPADAIANLLGGVTVLTATVDYNETQALPVEDVHAFYSDGDPNTLDGVVTVNGEHVGYKDVSTNPPALRGLVRGMFFTRNAPPDDPSVAKTFHPEGSLVRDFRASKVAWDPIFRFVGTAREGELARFESVTALRKIADWEYSTFAAAFFFHGSGVTFSTLKEWGVAKDKLERAGLDPKSLDDAASKENQDAKELETAEKELRKLGLEPDKLRRFGGDRAIVRAWDLLKTLDEDQRAALIASYRERAQKLEEREIKHLDFWRGEVKRQLDDIITLREQTPEVEAFGRIEMERLRPYLTVDAPHDGEAWTDPQVVNHAVKYDPYQRDARLRIQDGRRFRRGMILRIQPFPGVERAPGVPKPVEYRRVMGVRRIQDHVELAVFPQLEDDFEQSQIEVSGLLPKPINVNAAPKEVLVAVLVGLQTRLFQKVSATGRTAPNVVTPTEAAAVADLIMAAPLRSHLELKALLDKARDDGVIDQGDAEAILQNAVDPGDPKLAHPSLPFCYSSGDVYEVTATGIVNDDAGNEVSRVKTREVVQVAPPRDLGWHLDAQLDLQDRVASRETPQAKAPRGMIAAFVRGRWSNLFETFPVDVFASPWLEPDRVHGGPGSMQLAMSRDYDQPLAKPERPRGLTWDDWNPGFTGPGDHFDLEREAHPLAGPFPIAAARFQGRNVVLESAANRKYLGPSSVRAWFKVDRLSADRTYFFDSGQDATRDRISLYYDGKTKELVATIRDESLDALETGGNPRPTCEVRAPVQLKPENWYHVGLAWKGPGRGDLAIVLDGKPLGKDQTGTRLTAAMDDITLTVPVESTAGFPDRGWIRIGGYRNADSILAGDVFRNGNQGYPQSYGEVVYYESKTPTSFVLAAGQDDYVNQWRNRYGAAIPPPPGSLDPIREPKRGTGRHRLLVGLGNDPPFVVRRGYAHETGAPVEIWGYTMWLKNGPNWPTRSNQNTSLPPKLPTYTETIHVGGATLLDPLPENTPFTFVYKPNPPGWKKNGTPQEQRPVVCTAADTEIPVVWAALYPDGGTITGGFPRQGFLRVGNERIFYRDIVQDPAGYAKFVTTLADRGLDGTGAQPHHLWEVVCLESIRVSSTQDYPTRNHLYEPQVFLQLTPPLPLAARQIMQDPRTPPQVEWLSVLSAEARYGTTWWLIPNFQPNGINPQQNRLFGPDPNGTQPRFVGRPTALGSPAFVDLPQQDLRFRDAMIQLFDQMNGRLPPNPGLAPLAVTPATSNPPGMGQSPIKTNETRALKEWLKQVEPSFARAQKNTSVVPVRTAANPTTSSTGGGRPHDAGEKIVPTFVLGISHPYPQFDGRELSYAWKGDVVTVCDDTNANAREERTITWTAGTDAGESVSPSMHGDYGTGTLVAFDDFVARPYTGAAAGRIVKYPSGQMPLGPKDFAAGGAAVADPRGPGLLQGKIDEVLTTAEEEPSVYEAQVRGGQRWPQTATLGAADAAWDTCIPRNNGTTNALRGGVLLRLDDEFLVVRDVDALGGALGQSVRLVRGALGTQGAAHGPEAPLWWNFPFPRLAIVETGFSVPREDQFTIRPRPGEGQLDDRDFFVALDRGNGQGPQEIFPIKEQRRSFLLRPRDRFDRGAFRGSFGSGVASPNPAGGDALFDWPFRYQDRYTPRLSSLEGAFFQATREAPGAYFESITWDAALPNAYTRLVVAVRVDGAPSWDAEPAKKSEPGQPGRLYLFDDPKEANKILLRGDRIEVRVYPVFRAGAYANDAWKQTPILKGIHVTYRQPNRVLRREELLE